MDLLVGIGPRLGMLEGIRARMSNERSDEWCGDSAGWEAGSVAAGECVDGRDNGGMGGNIETEDWATGGGGAFGGMSFPTDAQLTEALQVAVAAGPRWLAAIN